MKYEQDSRTARGSKAPAGSRRKNSGKRGNQGEGINLPGILITALFVLMEGWFFYRLLRMNFLPTEHMCLVAGGLFVLTCIVAVLCWNVRRIIRFAIGTLLAAVLSVGMIIASSGIVDKIFNTVNELIVPTSDVNQVVEVQMGVYALSGGEVQYLSDLEGRIVGIMETVDRDEAEQVLEELSRKLSSPLQVKVYTSPAEVIQALYSHDIQAAILDKDFVVSVLSDIPGFEDVAQRVYQLSEYRAERPTQSATLPLEASATTAADATEDSAAASGSSRSWVIIEGKNRPIVESDATAGPHVETTDSAQTPESRTETDPAPTQPPVAERIHVPSGQENRVFMVYISGLDNRGGGLANRGNSDVNILACVNMNTRQILLVNTPRDYYVAFPTVGGTDKLTHAGYYGVDASMAALRNLYGVSPQYYVQIGFDGLTRFVNALGGVSAYSAYSFENQGYSFVQGYNDMDGAKALVFARSRYNVPGGDRARGQNQMALIKAMVAKLSSASTWSNFNQILDSLGGLIRTSVPYDIIASVSQSVLGGESWNIVSYSVDGSNGNAYCFSIGSANYVMYPDYGTVGYAQSLIRRLVNGEYVSP